MSDRIGVCDNCGRWPRFLTAVKIGGIEIFICSRCDKLLLEYDQLDHTLKGEVQKGKTHERVDQ